jgi:hypothetical protein
MWGQPPSAVRRAQFACASIVRYCPKERKSRTQDSCTKSHMFLWSMHKQNKACPTLRDFSKEEAASDRWCRLNARMFSQASVSRDVLPPTPPGPEGSNGNGLLRVQRASGAWLFLPCSFRSVYELLHFLYDSLRNKTSAEHSKDIMARSTGGPHSKRMRKAK